VLIKDKENCVGAINRNIIKKKGKVKKQIIKNNGNSKKHFYSTLLCAFAII